MGEILTFLIDFMDSEIKRDVGNYSLVMPIFVKKKKRGGYVLLQILPSSGVKVDSSFIEVLLGGISKMRIFL